MPRSAKRFHAWMTTLLAVNILAMVWIHHDLTEARGARIRVLSAWPTRDVDSTDRFALVFDGPLADPALIGQPLQRAPFEIEPRPSGCWSWAEAGRLEFRLDRPLPAGRVFRIRPAADFEAQTGHALVGDAEFRFQTRPLRLLSCDLDSSDHSYGNIVLRFNQCVVPADLVEHLKVTPVRGPARARDRRPWAEPSCLTREPAREIVVRVRRPPVGDEYRLVLDGKLTGASGELPLGSPVTKRVRFTPAFALEAARTSARSFARNTSVALDFTRRLKHDQPKPVVRLEPRVPGVRTRFSWDDLILSGPFECGRRYTATVGPNLLEADGQALGRSRTISFEVPDRDPGLRFTASNGILNPHGNLTLDLEVVNIAGVKLSTSRVIANNLVPHLRGDGPRETSRHVVHRTVELDLDRNEAEKLAVKLDDLLDAPLGVYRIKARAEDRTWTSDSAIVAVTDLAITSKQERSGHFVSVLSLSTAQPVAGAEITAVSYNNQVLAAAITAEDGTAQLEVPAKHCDGPTWVIVAQHEEDLAYLLVDERSWVLDEVDQSGRDIPTTYDAMLYAERGVYRPGDTIHLTGILRGADGTVPLPFPLSIDVYRPDGRKVATMTNTPEADSHGVFHAEFPTPDDGHLGRYRFAVTLPGSASVLGETEALVEAFLPVRIELEAEPTALGYEPGQIPEVSATARYLFGKPAAGLPLTVTGQYRLVPFESQCYQGFTFGDANQTNSFAIDEVETALDDSGQATVTIEQLPDDGKPHGLWRGSLTVTVTETGSRSVSTNLSVLADTAGRHVGLRLPAGRLVALDDPVDIEWVQVLGTDKPADPGPVDLTVNLVEYDWVLEEVDDRLVWKTTERLESVFEQTVNGGPVALAQGTVPIKCPEPGLYRIIAVDGRSRGRSVLEFHAAADRAEAELLALRSPDRLEIVLDQERYAPGSTAHVLVRSPFPGTLLLTMETDRVIHQEVVEMVGNAEALGLEVPEDLRGGAFVSGTVVRAVDPTQDKWLPHRAIGLARLATDHGEHELNLEIDAPAQARPGDPVRVTVQAECPVDPATPPVIHLWGVADGILLTTAYQTPDPMDHFFAPRAALVETADTLADLLPDHRRPASMQHIGAGWDGEFPDDLRRNPVPVKQRLPAVVWRTAIPTGADGRLSTELIMPALTGRMRLMAVAVQEDRYGSAEQAVTITAPLIVEAGTPRFAAPGDSFEIPVKLFNNTAEPLAVTLTHEFDGPLLLTGPEGLELVTVRPGTSELVWLSAEATGLGQVEIGFVGTAKSKTHGHLLATNEARFPIRPTSPLHAESRLLRTLAGEALTLPPPAGLLTSTVRTTVRLSASPEVELLPAVDALIGYPYGCVEQTTSRLFALLHAGRVLALESPEDIRATQVEGMIKAGIARLWSMQTRSGGLGYWAGAQYGDLWGSAYAASFLIEARQAGYAIDDRFLSDLAAFLEEAMHHDPDDGLGPDVRALLCRVLTALEQPPLGWMARLGERLDQLDIAGRAHLVSAWQGVGKRDRALAALADDTLEQSIAPATGGRITSQVRQEAVLLSTLCGLDSAHPWIPTLVKRLEAARKDGRWGNTLENATAVGALATYQSAVSQEVCFTGTVTIGDEEILAFDHTMPAAIGIPRHTEPISVATAGQGMVYLAVTSEGLLRDELVRPYDRQLRVRRRWESPGGEAVDRSRVSVGDLIHVEVTYAAPRLGRYEQLRNIVIVDALPGGMEIENPRLITSARPGHESESEPDRVEFLDDRVLIFDSATKGEQAFKYTLRAVSAGSFAVPPIQASCMYDAGFACLHGGGRVEIER